MQALIHRTYLHKQFNGVLTFDNAGEVREAARLAPDGRLLIETDSPYLAPAPHRGKRCEPGHVVHTLERPSQPFGDNTVVTRGPAGGDKPTAYR